jgi:hypothetical protein
MTTTQPNSSAPNYEAIWSSARRLHPIYVELAREFVIEAPGFPALDEPADAPDRETVEQAQKWIDEMDERIQVHQLRQFLQTSSIVDNQGLEELIRHFIAKARHTDSSRDKIDFLLVQYFSQKAPTQLDDKGADIAYVAGELKAVLGEVELKTPVWLNSLDRVLDAARRCQSLDELLHGGVLEQGRKAKAQAGELFYMPVALVAFTRFGYLMRRAFFRLMLTDLNNILDGLNALEEKGVETIDCRRAQFSAQEPVPRLRMICQSWKVMFQAEYSSGQPLRMLVDLRASVDAALNSGTDGGSEENLERTAAAKAALAAGGKPKAAAAAASASGGSKAKIAPEAQAKTKTLPAVSKTDAPEFEVSANAPEWNPEEEPQPRKKK